ncbi:hypothetical protein L596_020953 [Steinernema carpocapsae]|uniref:Uncharacterized protein n=1 Tax=Steinernema carpocapsae TaxID=34508 RepID=A0A4U5MV90_STECR|nr:hypothetical protein L596_020953 [Steinernema carpocapsae]
MYGKTSFVMVTCGLEFAISLTLNLVPTFREELGCSLIASKFVLRTSETTFMICWHWFVHHKRVVQTKVKQCKF